MLKEAIREALALAGRSDIAMPGSNGDDGYPNIRAMSKMQNEGLNTIWFSTNTSSRRPDQIVRNPKAYVYFVDFKQWMDLMIVGDIELLPC